MAETKINLSEEDKKKIIAWLDSKWKGHKCDVCGTNNWALLEHLLIAPIYTEGSYLMAGPVYPQAVCVCHNCAQTKFFNAAMIGLDATAPKQQKPEDGNG